MALTVYDYREDVMNVLVTPQIRSRFMRMEPGEGGGAHSHDLGHEVFLVLEGRAEFTIDGETGIVGPGQMCVALVDQLHSLRVVGDEPMTMYLSVTPHIQPTHTMWTDDGTRMPHRFAPSSAYDRNTDTNTPLAALLDSLTAATVAVREAAAHAASPRRASPKGWRMPYRAAISTCRPGPGTQSGTRSSRSTGAPRSLPTCGTTSRPAPAGRRPGRSGGSTWTGYA